MKFNSQNTKKTLLNSLSAMVMMFLFITSAEAKNISFNGAVVEAETRVPLTNVRVVFTEDSNSIRDFHLNENAVFKIDYDFSDKKNYRLEFSKDEYHTYSIDLSNVMKAGKLPNNMRISLAKELKSFPFTGSVVDRDTGAPVHKAKITITNIQTGEVINPSINYEGKYTLNIASGYEYEIEIQSGKFLKRFTKINYCGDTLENRNKYCFSGFSEVGLNENGGVSGASVLIDKIVIGKKFEVDNIYYDYNKATLRPDAIPNLRKLLFVLEDNPQIIIELGSHADSRGSDAYNLKLSKRRAQSAVDYIVGQGIAADRIVAKGYGETKLVNECANRVKCSDEKHEANRRTEFIIIDIDESKIEK